MSSRRALFGTVWAAALAVGLYSVSSHAALQGRDLNGSAGSFEAYYDTVLDITWLANANVNGAMTWAAANTWAANLSFTDGVNVYDNWRLPTVEPVNGVSFNYSFSYNGSTDYGYNITSPQSEMAHLFYVTLGNPGLYTPAGAVSGCYVSIPTPASTTPAPSPIFRPAPTGPPPRSTRLKRGHSTSATEAKAPTPAVISAMRTKNIISLSTR